MYLLVSKGFAQNEDSGPALKITGYIDTYYGYYTDSVGNDNYQKFPSISPRSNQFGLNTAQIGFQYDADRIRGGPCIPTVTCVPVFVRTEGHWTKTI